MTPEQAEYVITIYNVKTMAIKNFIIKDYEHKNYYEYYLEDDEVMFVNGIYPELLDT
jgi:hypothetical protein